MSPSIQWVDDRWTVSGIKNGAVSVRHQGSCLHATLRAGYVVNHVELGYASTVHTAQGLTADAMHGIVTGEESRQTLYTMLTRGRAENHVHLVLGEVGADHAPADPSLERQATATELLEVVLARDSAAVSATTARAVAASPEAQLRDAVARYADALAVAATSTRVDLDSAPPGPLPWLAGVPDALTDHAAWGPYLTARARRVSTLPHWMHRYDDVLTPALRATLALWRAGVGIKANDRTLAGAAPTDVREATFHRRLIRTINARHDEAVKVWEERIVEHIGRHDEQTVELARHLDRLARRGIDALHVLDLAAGRKPLPVDRPTAALAYRVRDTATTNHTRRGFPVDEPFRRSTKPSGGPTLGLSSSVLGQGRHGAVRPRGPGVEPRTRQRPF